MRKSQWINHYAPRDQVCRVLWTWEQCQMWSWATLNCSVPFSDSTRWSMHSLKKNLLEWRWIWTFSFGIMWSLANSFSINQFGRWWPISKSSWRIWILRGCRIQTQIDPQSSDESIVSINVWSFVISIFQCFVAGIHSCWASPQAKVLSAENRALVIVASHCILTSELERFCETNLAHGSAKLVENIFGKRPYLGKRGKCCAKASAKAVHLVPIYLTILGESQKQNPSCSPRCDKGSPQLSANWLPGTPCSINHGQNQNFPKTNPDCWLNQETLHVDWWHHSVVYGLTIFHVWDPRLPKDNDPKTPRGSCAHPPWSLRSSPESSASPRDQIPEGETEKPRNHLHRRSCNIPRTKHKECTEEYSDRWRNVCFACTCSSNQKEKDFPMLLGNLQKLQFHPRFCYPATSQTGLFFLANPIFSGWKHSSATHQTSVLVLQRQDLLLIDSCSIHLSVGSHGLKLFGLRCATRWFHSIFECK